MEEWRTLALFIWIEWMEEWRTLALFIWIEWIVRWRTLVRFFWMVRGVPVPSITFVHEDGPFLLKGISSSGTQPG
jgi:hypothetical protein